MSKFDKYGSGAPLLSSSGQTGAVTRRVASELANAAAVAQASGSADAILRRKPARIAIALDATGSMAHLLRSAKDAIGQIITRAAQEAGQPIEVELFAYRDYDVPHAVVQRSGSFADPQKLIAWLDGIDAMGGGANEGEAVEAALQLIVADGTFSAVLIAGDEPSNGLSSLASAGRRNTPTAGALAEKLGAAKVPLHSFVIGNDPRTVADFRRLAELSGGKSGRLDGSREMTDLAVLAILAALKGANAVRRYAEATQLTSNGRDFAQLLLGSR